VVLDVEIVTIGLKTRGYLKKCLWHSFLRVRVKQWTATVKLVNGYLFFNSLKYPKNQ
jgi:hypothetical protein